MALVVPYQGISPKIHPSAFLAPNATVIGDLEVGEGSGIWFGAVLRGDVMPLRVGKRTSIQDNSVLHATGGWSATTVGDDVTVGHAVILHGCTIHDRVLVGMGSIVLDGVVIGERSIIGAGALVTGGTIIPPGSLVIGSPAKVVRTLSLDEQAKVKIWAEKYVAQSKKYMER